MQILQLPLRNTNEVLHIYIDQNLNIFEEPGWCILLKSKLVELCYWAVLLSLVPQAVSPHCHNHCQLQ